MTPQEKAKELVDKFQKQIFFEITDERLDINESKGCALIAVEEILDVDYYDMSEELFDNHIEYWEQVKHEIEKL